MISDIESVFDMIDRFNSEPPRAWAIIANNAYGQMENETLIAVFDTEQDARRYEQASRLVGDDRPKVGRIYRTYRPDSLLWDFNPERGGWDRGEMVTPCGLWREVLSVPHNPSPPSGECQEIVADAAGTPVGNVISC